MKSGITPFTTVKFFKMKFPKYFFKMTLDEQESWLVERIFKIDEDREQVRKQLSRVRGGLRVEPSIEERPDLEILKAP